MAVLSRALFCFMVLLVSFSAVVEAKDLYKILGVEKNASQRDIQKAFHRLSLKYHPDKNPAKSAQAKFAEINNAYEVLSDEEKRKNYDLFGDEQGRATRGGPEYNNDGYTGFQNSGHGGEWRHYTYSSNDNSKSRFEDSNDFREGGAYSQGGFPYGSASGRQERSSFFGFGGDSSYFGNIFDNLFSSAWDNHQGENRHYTSHAKSNSEKSKSYFQGSGSGSQSKQQSSIASSEQLTSKNFQKKVLDQFHTWAVLFTPDVSNDFREKLQLLEQTSAALQGSVKVGFVHCEMHKALCREQKLWPLKIPKLVLFSLRANGKLVPLEYTGDWSLKGVKGYCIEVLPRFSKKINANDFDDEMTLEVDSPRLVLLTRKKEAPALWRALAGQFHGRVLFYDVQVDEDDALDHFANKLGIKTVPAIVGIFPNGETIVLSTQGQGSSMEELAALIEEFEMKSKTAGPRKTRAKAEGEIPLLTKKNTKDVCSRDTSLCIIGAYRSSSGKDKLKQILKEISQKSLTRREQRVDALKRPISYALLDARKQWQFLSSFDQSASSEHDVILVAYKPKKGTYAMYHPGPISIEKIENFVIEVVSGDVQLKQVKQDPILV